MTLWIVAAFLGFQFTSPGLSPTVPPSASISRQHTPPVVLYRTEPQYPAEARKSHISGVVRLQAVIRKDGSVSITKVVQGLGHGLDESAMKALLLWKFKPGTRDGEPVDVTINVGIAFRLK